MAKTFMENMRSPAGFAGGYVALAESDFGAAAGASYTPPERGAYRRINVSRTIQLLQDAPRVLETFQTSAAVLRLPSNQIGTDETGNDAGDGRDFWLKNSGTGDLSVLSSGGILLQTLPAGTMTIALSNSNQQWDFFFNAENIFFSDPLFVARNVKAALVELHTDVTNRARYAASCGFDGSAGGGRWLEFASTQPSSSAGFVIALPSTLRELSLAVTSNTTMDVRVYKNAVLQTNITLTAARKNIVVGLNTAFAALDELSMKVESGSGQYPVCNAFFSID